MFGFNAERNARRRIEEVLPADRGEAITREEACIQAAFLIGRCYGVANVFGVDEKQPLRAQFQDLFGRPIFSVAVFGKNTASFSMGAHGYELEHGEFQYRWQGEGGNRTVQDVKLEHLQRFLVETAAGRERETRLAVSPLNINEY